jgi:hypothetical protein
MAGNPGKPDVSPVGFPPSVIPSNPVLESISIKEVILRDSLQTIPILPEPAFRALINLFY